MTALDTAVAGEIRAARARRQMTQLELAEALRIRIGVELDQTAISRRIRGETPWTAGELIAVCDALDEDIARVFTAGREALHGRMRKSARKAARTTNPCLSYSARIGSNHLQRYAYPTREVTIDCGVKSA